jgi:hypothetical protein
MSYGIICGSKDCANYASHRYTWPGKDEAAICESCAGKLRGVANAIGLHVQLIPLTTADHADLGHPLAAAPKGGSVT